MEIQKNKRIKDPAMLKKVKDQAKGFCEYCGRYDKSLHAHHLKSAGSGGNDTPNNLIALCFTCHHMAHNVEIAKDKLKKIVEERERWNM